MAFSVDDTLRRAFAALQAGKFNDAEAAFKTLLKAEPRHVAGLNLLSVVLTQLGNFGEAEHYVRRALDENANSDATLYNYGIILKGLNRPTEALERFSQALGINPAVAETWSNRGTIFNDLKRYRDAIADFDKSISINQNYADAYCNKGKSLAGLKLYDQSLAAYDRALALRGDFAEAWIGRGRVLSELKQYQNALAAYDRALTLKSDLAEAWLGRGNLFAKLKQYDEALNAYNKALASRIDFAEAWTSRGNVFSDIKQYKDAFAAFDKALALKPDLAEAWLGRGNLFAELKQRDDALAAYDKALALDPDLAEAWFGRGNIFIACKQYCDALPAYDKALAIKPDIKYAEGSRLHAMMHMCDWTSLDVRVAHLLSGLRERALVSAPFSILSIPASPQDQLQCAECYIADQLPYPKMRRGERYIHDRIRIAYISADLRDHAMGYLMAGLFEQHDKSRFELIAISLGPELESDIRRRIKNSFEHFIDARAQSGQEIAELILRLEIDIAVDLHGFTEGGRLDILARRPAPIQVNYLGYPGTLGADYVDYILADQTIVPNDQRGFYAENVVWLPDSYQVNDTKRRISEHTPTRRQCGLPESGFVFCCFNNTFKITPDVFEVWMRLLKATEGSILWLLEGNSTASENLRREAESRGVSSMRLIDAPKTNLADHLARHRLADLFLDTQPYNAHTTASDALWAGLPVLTCLGSTFAGRVGASLVKAVGLSELVTNSLADYEALALKLAHDPALLASLKAKLASNRDTYPLFNTKRFTRHIEAAYVTMWEKYQRGEPPTSFAVDPVD